MNRIRKLILGFTLIIIALCGCGKDDGKTTENTTTATTTELTTEYIPVVATPEDAAQTDEDGFVIRDDYVKTVEDVVNARTQPEVDAPIYRILEKDVVLPRTGDNAEWTRVIIDETPFYVYSEFVEPTEAPAEETTETVDETSSVTDASGTDAVVSKEKKVVIDAGNQANANYETEAIGPNSKDEKQCATVGNVGIALSLKEYEVNLIYAKALAEELETRGYEVILTRESDSADITNKERAQAANTSGASVLIRIQMNYSTDTTNSGVMAICMSKNSPYNASLYTASYELATRLLQGILQQVDKTNRGIYETEELTLVNWSEIPVVVMKLGFLSNVQDEADIASEEYRKSVVEGMADGLDYYFAD